MPNLTPAQRFHKEFDGVFDLATNTIVESSDGKTYSRSAWLRMIDQYRHSAFLDLEAARDPASVTNNLFGSKPHGRRLRGGWGGGRFYGWQNADVTNADSAREWLNDAKLAWASW